MLNKVVRVAVNNNFNCTDAEFQQLDAFAAAYTDTLFFVNSNINTKLLHRINEHPYKAVITLNPDILWNNNQERKLLGINKDLISFVRIKYIPENPEIIGLIQNVREIYPVVITLQRFNGIKSISQYVPNFRKYYVHSNNRFRLTDDSMNDMLRKVGNDNTHVCDLKGLGCGGCGLCSTLTTGKSLPIYTLNLSSSGLCPFNCTDCYAKTMQHFLSKIGMPSIHFDWIHMNAKQSGKTKHIKSKRSQKK